jgi:hypothetical protein
MAFPEFTLDNVEQHLGITLRPGVVFSELPGGWLPERDVTNPGDAPRFFSGGTLG